MADLLRDVVTKALPALQAELSRIGNGITAFHGQLVKLTALIEGKGAGNFRPN